MIHRRSYLQCAGDITRDFARKPARDPEHDPRLLPHAAWSVIATMGGTLVQRERTGCRGPVQNLFESAPLMAHFRAASKTQGPSSLAQSEQRVPRLLRDLEGPVVRRDRQWIGIAQRRE